MRLFLLLSLCATLCCGRYDHDDWTDPTDMFNYDAATGKMIKEKTHNHKTEKKLEEVCEKDGECPGSSSSKAVVMDVEKPIQVPIQIEEPKHQEALKLPESNINPVFRRYLRKMLNEAERFGLPEDSSSDVYYEAEMVLSKQMVAEIQKFIEDEDWNLGPLEEALIRSLVRFRHHNVKDWWTGLFEDYFGVDLGTVFKFLLCILCIVSIIATELWSRIGWFTQIRRLCIICFLISVGWNWMYLYQVAFAERRAELAKLQKFDDSCGEKMSWGQSLLEWWRGVSVFQNDPCEEYFKALMINPALMVPPTKALALTFTDFITEPLKHVGKAMGEFLSGLLGEIPVLYQLVVLILIAAICLASCYGASVSFGQALVHRNHQEPPRERLPPAEPQGPPPGLHPPPQPYYIQPQFVPVYIHPGNQRPENLQALDVPNNRNHRRPPGITYVDSPSSDQRGEEEWREEEIPQKKPYREEREKTAESSDIRYRRKEELKERVDSPREKDTELENSFSQRQKKEEPPEQKSTKYQRKPDSTEETANSIQQSERKPVQEQNPSKEQIEVQPVNQNSYGDHRREEENERSAGLQQRGENLVEEISHGEELCEEQDPDDKSLEVKDVLKKDPSEQTTDREENKSGPL